jgi:hypothetical protein
VFGSKPVSVALVIFTPTDRTFCVGSVAYFTRNPVSSEDISCQLHSILALDKATPAKFNGADGAALVGYVETMFAYVSSLRLKSPLP